MLLDFYLRFFFTIKIFSLTFNITRKLIVTRGISQEFRLPTSCVVYIRELK